MCFSTLEIVISGWIQDGFGPTTWWFEEILLILQPKTDRVTSRLSSAVRSLLMLMQYQ